MNNIDQRTLAREYAIKFLYHLHLSEFDELRTKLFQDMSDSDQTFDIFREFDISYAEVDIEHPNNQLNENIKEHAIQLLKGIIEENKQIIELIQQSLNNWEYDKINKIDLVILFLGTFELKNMINTPTRVIINEAVNLAKKYGTASSYSFINGILDKVAKSCR